MLVRGSGFVISVFVDFVAVWVMELMVLMAVLNGNVWIMVSLVF